MQTLIDKNDALKKEIDDLRKKVEKVKKTPIKRKKPAASKRKKGSGKRKKSMFNTLRGMVGFKDESLKLANPKRMEMISEIHELFLKESYGEVDLMVEENQKLLFGKPKKGEETPSAFTLLDEFGESVLVKAIKEGLSDLALSWIEKDTVDSDVVDKDGMTPLMVAAKFGDEAVCKALAPKANKDGKTKYTKKTALHFAAEQGHLKVVQILLDSGCDCTLEDSQGLKAFQATRSVAVRDLIKEVMTRQGKAPSPEEEEIERAVEGEEEGKGRSYSQDEEMRPLFEEHDRLLKLKKRLELQHDDLIGKRNPKSKFDKLINMDEEAKKKFLGLEKAGLEDRVKKFHFLVKRGDDDNSLEEVEALLTETKKELKIDKNAKDEFGETALMKAARLGFEEMLSILLLYRCNTEIKDVEGYTALMKAAQFGKRECVEKLIGEGADVNATSRKGKYSALMLAAERGHADICELLIKERADHSLKNSEGLKAVDLTKNEEAKERIQRAMEAHPVRRPQVQI